MDLQQEIELRIDSLKRAALQAMEKPEVKAYLEILKNYAEIKFIKDNLTIEEYNSKIDELMEETDKAKENPTVKLFIEIVEKHRSLVATKEMLYKPTEGPKLS